MAAKADGRVHHQIVPNHDLGLGILRRLGGETRGSDRAQEALLNAVGIFTAGKYLNKLKRDRIHPLPHTMAFDEAHHTEAKTYEAIRELVGRVPRVGFTATTYRGTPAGTAALLTSWDHDVYEVLSLRQAVDMGIIRKPTFSVWPLLNDDLISVSNGEFVVSQVDSLVKDKMGDLVDRIAPFFDGSLWDRPTMLALSSVEQVAYAESSFRSRGLPVVCVTGATGSDSRQQAFARVIAREALLLQIKVVSEGVDLPMRRLIDVAPAMSPVAWMQRVGRITRPTDEPLPPEYITCNHNLIRHAYLWSGLIPPLEIRKAQQAWGEEWKPNRRTLARALGLDGFGRFAVSSIPLLDGLVGSFYGLSSSDGSQEYAVFLHPTNPTPLFFSRVNTRDVDPSVLKTLPDGRETVGLKRRYGRWTRILQMPDVDRFVSMKPNPLTPGQVAWWKSGASRFGLDPEAQIDARQFQLLPILRDVSGRIRTL